MNCGLVRLATERGSDAILIAERSCRSTTRKAGGIMGELAMNLRLRVEGKSQRLNDFVRPGLFSIAHCKTHRHGSVINVGELLVTICRN